MIASRDNMNGWINLDKDPGLTSTQALGKIKRLFGIKKRGPKVGHAGTLDPLATGCLPVAIGEATKTISFAQDKTKIYEFDVTWGASRTTDDLEGDVVHTSDDRPEESMILALLSGYTGDIDQLPPQFAAVKVNGKRAYDIARQGNHANIQSRQVTIHSFEILHHSPDTTRFQVVCGKGVYIRALARDLGQDLGCYGHISHLRRLKVGPFGEKSMITLDNLEKIVHSGDLQTALQPVETMLDDIPALNLTQDEAARLKQGQNLAFVSRPHVARLEEAGIEVGAGTAVKAYANFRGQAIALIDVEGAEVKPARILNI